MKLPKMQLTDTCGAAVFFRFRFSRLCHDSHKDVRCCDKNVLRTGCFLMYLFSDQAIAIDFLKDVVLLRSKMLCNICHRDMTWSVQPNLSDGFRWRCRRRVAGTRCRESASIRHGSWFQLSKRSPGSSTSHLRHRVPRTRPQNPTRILLQWSYRHRLGHVLEGNHSGLLGGQLSKDRWS